MIKDLLFDYGGTIDTCGVHWYRKFKDAWEPLLDSCFTNFLPEAYIYAERKLAEPGAVSPNDDFHTLLQKKLCLQLTAMEKSARRKLTNAESMTLTWHLADELDEQVWANLEKSRNLLSRLSYYKLHLVSNFYGNLSAVISGYGLLKHFDTVTESAQIGIRKPDPAIWQHAVSLTGHRPDECLVIGDSLKNDMLPAHKVGCQTLWLCPDEEAENSLPEGFKPDYLCRNYEDILRQLRSLSPHESPSPDGRYGEVPVTDWP